MSDVLTVHLKLDVTLDKERSDKNILINVANDTNEHLLRLTTVIRHE